MVKRNKHSAGNGNNESSKVNSEPGIADESKVVNEDELQNAQITEESNIMNGDDKTGEIEMLKQQLEKKENELREYVDVAQRVKAEFENYKKRTAREKELLYTDISGDIIAKFLPIVDNLERAISSAPKSDETGKLIEGIEMTVKQFKDVLNKEGVEEIGAIGSVFNPSYHNAVMHIEDDAYGDNVVVEEFQKGYRIKDKVLRYSMVKVAN